MDEKGRADADSDASVVRGAGLAEQARARGFFTVRCFTKAGDERWADIFQNVVTVSGKNYALDAFLAGGGYTVTGPFLGLISGVAFSTVSGNDTMTSHAGWLEAGGVNAPLYAGDRRLAVWDAAADGTKVLSTPAVFNITGNGLVKGVFLTFGPGASATKDTTNGMLWSAGTFVSGDKSVSGGDMLNVSYSTSL